MRKFDYILIIVIIALFFIVKCSNTNKPVDVNNDWKDSLKAYNKREKLRDERMNVLESNQQKIDANYDRLSANTLNIKQALTTLKSTKNERVNYIYNMSFDENFLLFTRNLSEMDNTKR